MFDVPAAKKSRMEWHLDVDLSAKPWSVGLIVGPSGAGKSTIARELFGTTMANTASWPDDRAILDAFPETLTTADVVSLLTSVGFSSPPSWMRPFSVLSNGEQFRVQMARAIAERHADKPIVVDEFTSVIDRQVAQVASHTVQKTVRKLGAQFVAVSCHYDVLDWLQPDWILEPHTGEFRWRSPEGHPPFDVKSGPPSEATGRYFGSITI
jgi:ABC-type ATPase with predicted acetyltransferase domain